MRPSPARGQRLALGSIRRPVRVAEGGAHHHCGIDPAIPTLGLEHLDRRRELLLDLSTDRFQAVGIAAGGDLRAARSLRHQVGGALARQHTALAPAVAPVVRVADLRDRRFQEPVSRSGPHPRRPEQAPCRTSLGEATSVASGQPDTSVRPARTVRDTTRRPARLATPRAIVDRHGNCARASGAGVRARAPCPPGLIAR